MRDGAWGSLERVVAGGQDGVEEPEAVEEGEEAPCPLQLQEVQGGQVEDDCICSLPRELVAVVDSLAGGEPRHHPEAD